VNKLQAIEFLKQRLSEISQLAELPFDNQEYPLWRIKVRDVLEAVFGRDSSEFQDFSDCNWQAPMRTLRMLADLHASDYLANLQRIENVLLGIIQKYELLGLETNSETDKQKRKTGLQVGELAESAKSVSWKDIKSLFGITKTGFGKRINFITDPFKRIIIFRDVEQAFVLASLGFSKPAVILAGSVIEELLRLYLQYKQVKPIKGDFDGYIQTCEKEGLLKEGISRLSDSVRHFRNLVHLSKEKTRKDTISKATAIGAVSSIFTITSYF
jgi:hypothetical protein